MNIWLHRISYHAEVAYPLLENGYLSIGFSDFAKFPDFITASCNEKGAAAFDNYFEEQWNSVPKTRWSLWRFIAEMDKGDWVVVPSWGSFSVYEIVEPMARFVSEIDTTLIKDWHGNQLLKKENGLLCKQSGDKQDSIDLGFIRQVKLIEKGISRYEYADAALTSRMKIRSTNADINDLDTSVKKAIEAFRKGQPLNLQSQIISKTRQLVLDMITTDLTPDKFEVLVKWYFERIGASEVTIPAKNEIGKQGDADVVALFEPLKMIIYAQVKFHTNTTDTWAVEQIRDYKISKDAIDDGYSKVCWVVSTCSCFSEEAYKNAKESAVQLIDGNQFTAMLLNAGFSNLDRKQI